MLVSIIGQKWKQQIEKGMNMSETMITREMKIEQLVELKADAVGYLFHKRIRCIRCGEPVWDTIEEAARKVNYSEEEIDQLIEELNHLD
jgi:uncharacterized protein with PIN domain